MKKIKLTIITKTPDSYGENRQIETGAPDRQHLGR
jgi:hypothetical protein